MKKKRKKEDWLIEWIIPNLPTPPRNNLWWPRLGGLWCYHSFRIPFGFSQNSSPWVFIDIQVCMVTLLWVWNELCWLSVVTVDKSIKEGQSIALAAEPLNGGSLLPQDWWFCLSSFHPSLFISIGSYEQASPLQKDKKPAGPRLIANSWARPLMQHMSGSSLKAVLADG